MFSSPFVETIRCILQVLGSVCRHPGICENVDDDDELRCPTVPLSQVIVFLLPLCTRRVLPENLSF